MSEWNLSVRLTGQGSGLARTLRDLAGDARDASRDVNALKRDIQLLRREARRNIRIRLDVDAGHLRSDVSTALTSARAGQNLRVRLDVDAAHLRADVSAALTAAGSGQGLTVNLRLGNAAQLRREVEDAVRWAAWGHRIEIPIGLADPMQLRRDVSDAVRWASMHQTITVRVTPDTSALRTLGGTLGGSGGGGGGADFGLAGLLPIVTAAIPLVAGLTTTVAPLAGMLVATGGAATAFGIALAGQIGPLGEVADAEKKYQEAVRDHGARSKEAIDAQVAYQKQLSELPPETQKAAVALSSLKTTFADWSDEMSGFTMQPVTKGFTVLEQIIPRLSPEVESFSGQLDRLMNVAGGAVASPAFDALADDVAKLTDQKLDDFTDQVIHLLRIVSQGDAGGGVIGQILGYMRENGPAAREAVNAIGEAIGTLAEGAAAAGPTMLTLVTAAAKLVAAMPPELVAIILQTAAALKLLQLSGAGFAALAGGVAAIRAQIALLAGASAAAGGGLAGLRAAFLALGTAAKASVIVAGIGALVYVLSELSTMGKDAPPDVDKLTTSLRQLGSTGKVTGEAARAFGKDLGDLYEKVRSLTDPSTTDDVQQFIVSLGGIASWDSTPVKEAKENINAIDEALAGLVKNGQADLAAAALKKLTAEYGKGGRDTGQFTSQLDDYKSALADAKFEQELTAAAMGLFGQAAMDTAGKLDAQKASADGLRQSIVALNDVNRAAGSAMSAFEQSIDDVTEATKEHSGALKMRDGDLDLGSEKAREAEKVLSGLAANTDAAATAARDQGRSWEYVNGIYDRGQDAFIKAAQAMGLTKTQAEALSKSYLAMPDSKTTKVNMEAEDAKADLDAFNAKVAASPGTKSVTLKTLSSAAEKILEAFGYKVTHLKDGSVTVTAQTGGALTGVQNVAGAIAALRDKTVTVTTVRQTVFTTQGTPNKVAPAHRDYAQGGVVDYYAQGGIRPGRVSFFANGSADPGDRRNQHMAEIVPAGSWRVFGEDETQGEGYVPFRQSARPRSRAITEEIVRRLGGDPAGISWHANGSVTDWRYDPASGSLYSSSDILAAGNKTKKVKVKGKNGKTTTKEIEYFDLAAVEKKLWSAGRATAAWNRDLEKVAERAGGDVAQALASMGEEGMALTKKMANGTNKYVAQMSIALRNLAKTARATLGDYSVQLNHATANQNIFTKNLATLAARGYGDLASQLAAQNDEAAHDLAAAATGDSKKAAKANAAAKAANNALTSEDVRSLVQIIAAIKSKSTGLHDVAGTTGLGEDEIITIANKAKSQISSSLGSRAERFLADLGKANKGLAYENGGIRAGLYATQGGIVRFAEPSTHGEAYIPLGANKRRTALPVLTDVANRFGVGLTDGQANRVVIIREAAPLVGESHFHIGDRKSDRDLARAIEYRQSYQLRRLARGGVGARG